MLKVKKIEEIHSNVKRKINKISANSYHVTNLTFHLARGARMSRHIHRSDTLEIVQDLRIDELDLADTIW